MLRGLLRVTDTTTASRGIRFSRRHMSALYTIQRKGDTQFLVAACDLLPGTITVQETATAQAHADMHTIQVAKSLHIDCKGPIRFTNHSCAPNCAMRLEQLAGSKDQYSVRLVSEQSIARGDLLTFDYATTEWDMAAAFDCGCGSSSCRGQICGFKHLKQKDRQQLISTGLVAEHIMRLRTAADDDNTTAH